MARKRKGLGNLGTVVRTTSSLRTHVKKTCGSHFFDADTMRFFNSQLETKVFPSSQQNATYFVTSEQFVPSHGPRSARKFSIRRLKGCSIDTVGEFQGYATRAGAYREAGRLAADAVALRGTKKRRRR